MDDAAISAEQRIVTSVFCILISAMLAAFFRGRFCLSFNIFTLLRGLLRAPLKAAPEVSAPVGEGISRHRSRPKAPVDPRRLLTCPATRRAVWELKTGTFVASL